MVDELDGADDDLGNPGEFNPDPVIKREELGHHESGDAKQHDRAGDGGNGRTGESFFEFAQHLVLSLEQCGGTGETLGYVGALFAGLSEQLDFKGKYLGTLLH